MGLKYVAFRFFYEFKKRLGILKISFPTHISSKSYTTLNEWKHKSIPFFFNNKEQLQDFTLSNQAKQKLKEEYELIIAGKLIFFSSTIYDLGIDYNWITNPDTGYTYDINKHWSNINDYSPANGDIKYVWEKSRFSYIYTLIRYDKHFNVDTSAFVFNQIIDWIDKNPINKGPNYVCSQEISLRILNWTFALYYFKNTSNLTDVVFDKIMNSIYAQLLHVESNINFSRIAVRNNHAITETLMLFLGGILFPFFKESSRWKEKGLNYLEKEIEYQIYKDGSYIQYSFNYQRVVVQLLTWAIFLSEQNNLKLSNKSHQRIYKCFDFLYQLQDDKTGRLPNYGANDGALFFPLNSCDYRDYRPQLNALYFALQKQTLYTDGDWLEDVFWYTGQNQFNFKSCERRTSAYHETGYFVLRNTNKMTFLRCGNHKDRPSQADNLHVDVWVDGINLLRDAGSYKYNTNADDLSFFMGTKSHNTVQLGNFDQMLKGGRFIWYNWSSAEYAKITEDDEWIVFEGKVHAYQHINKNIKHKRIVKQHKTKLAWLIEDIIFNNTVEAHQRWNIHPNFYDLGYKISSYDSSNNEILGNKEKTYYSPYYGVKEKSTQIVFTTHSNYFKTMIYKSDDI